MQYALSNKRKGQLIKIFWITIAWMIISILRFLTGYVDISDQTFNCDISQLNFSLFLTASALVGLVAGSLGGTLLVLLWEKWLRSKRYGAALFNIFWSYTLVYLVVSVVAGLFLGSSQLQLSAFHPEVLNMIFIEIFSIGSLHSLLFWLFVVIGTLVTLLVNDKYGPGVFVDFLLGRYFQPRKEERIFMFLDLRSSTSIAEKIGEDKYFNFLKDVFEFSTSAILHSKGEIYQYVGDEIVISWKTNNGLQDENCIRCFFEIQKSLRDRGNYFQNEYSVVPEFKAGLHYGYVMAGEIGVIKREISFIGDVLNTTSRIQSKCNELGVNILLSKSLWDKFALRRPTYTPKMIGDIPLRGKIDNMDLFTLV